MAAVLEPAWKPTDEGQDWLLVPGETAAIKNDIPAEHGERPGQRDADPAGMSPPGGTHSPLHFCQAVPA
jgi:hypothetical protein